MNIVVIYLVLLMLGISVAAGMLNRRYCLLPYRLITFQLLLALVNELCSILFPGPNVDRFNIYILVEQALLAGAGLCRTAPQLLRRVLGAALIFSAGIWCWNIAQLHPYQFANKAFLAGCILIAVIYLRVLMQVAAEDTPLVRHPLFWICTGHILYFGCDIPFFSLYDYFTLQNRRLGKYLFVINSGLAVLRYGCVACGLLLTRYTAAPHEQQHP